ncbi:hypothetical protein ACK3Z9_12185 [Aeromonas caviae]
MKKLLFISFLFLILLILFYIYGIDGHYLSHSNSNLGDFGSYFGGVASPILSFFSIIFIYKTIVQTDINHSKQLEIVLKQDRRSKLLHLLHSYNTFLDANISDVSRNFNLKHKTLLIYLGDNIEITYPDSTLRSALMDFQYNISDKKRFHPNYLDFIEFLSANAEYCLTRTFEYALKITDASEFEESIDLIETLADQHCTIGFLELGIRQLYNNKKNPLLDQLSLINERTRYLSEWSIKYKKTIELINTHEN